MEHTSLQSYLDFCFADSTVVTDSMVLRAKQQWRKLYLSRYQKQYQQRYVQISFRISKKEHREFELLAERMGLKITTLIKQIVLSKREGFSSFDREPLSLLLLQSIDMIEEAIHENEAIETSMLISLLEQMQTLLK